MSKKNVMMYMDTAIIEEAQAKFPGRVSQMCENYLRESINHEDFIVDDIELTELKEQLQQEEIEQATKRNQMNILRAEIKRKEAEAEKAQEEDMVRRRAGYKGLIDSGILRKIGTERARGKEVLEVWEEMDAARHEREAEEEKKKKGGKRQ